MVGVAQKSSTMKMELRRALDLATQSGDLEKRAGAAVEETRIQLGRVKKRGR